MTRTRDDSRRDQQKTPEELEHEIDAKRAELSAALDELEESLAPRELLDDMMEIVTDRLRRDGAEFMENLGNHVKQNPVPALLTSVGLVWMMAASDRGRAADTRPTTRTRANGPTEESETPGFESAARAGLGRLLHEQPLALGMLSLAAGAIAGAALPAARVGDETEKRATG